MTKCVLFMFWRRAGRGEEGRSRENNAENEQMKLANVIKVFLYYVYILVLIYYIIPWDLECADMIDVHA